MLTTTGTYIQQVGNGVTTAFNFSFKILAATDLQVNLTINGLTGSNLVNGVDYTVVFDSIAETGTVTFTVAPVSGALVNIQRVSDNTQQSGFPREGVTPARTFETALDKMTALIQEDQAAIKLITVLASPILKGNFAALDALTVGTTGPPFIGIVTDTRTIQLFLGDRTLGQNGWAPLGGF
jgi:Phage T7 tail fibre protein